MRDLSTLTFHPVVEQIVSLLCERTQNTKPQFFRMMVCYYLCKMAGTMRVIVDTKDRGEIPVNFYGVNLGISGIGKGHSTNILEEQLIHKFRQVFFDVTLPKISEDSIKTLTVKRVNIHNQNPSNAAMIEYDDMFDQVRKEFDELGQLAFSFDSGTTAAVKQMRHKLLMADIGAMNLEIDEIGSNLLGNVDVLNTFLELFDVGKVKQKLTKNTKENTRSAEIDGKTPTNLMLFGTPAKLFDGSKTEEEFRSFLQTGYGRRCFFGYTKGSGRNKALTAADIYDRLTSQSSDQLIQSLSNRFAVLASEVNYKKKIQVSKDVSLILIEYKLWCENEADKLGDHEEEAKAELSHRYFKALKLAGAYAFIDGHGEITEDNLYHAIAFAEESGRAFKQMMTQDKNYVKLAKYLAAIGREQTHVDLTESLPFFKGSQSQKSDLLQLAIAYGYKNCIVIKRKIENNIEFITGETLEPTDPEKMILAWSDDIATGYQNEYGPWSQLTRLLGAPNLHWINHHSTSGRRSGENMIPGFNMVVLDIDGGGTTIEMARSLLGKYSYLIHTTKRHTPDAHRFRLIIPMNYTLKLNEEDFNEFMRNIYEWLPFPCDVDTAQRCRKWATTDGAQIFTNDGEMLDALEFIPRTSKNDERQQKMLDCHNMSSVERWFLTNTDNGSRNNKLLRYGMLLIDAGYQLPDIQKMVDELNQKLEQPLPSDEIASTIMRSVTKKYYQNGGT